MIEVFLKGNLVSIRSAYSKERALDSRGYLFVEGDFYDARERKGGEFAFFIGEAKKSSGPVLELASGGGRMLIPLVKAGLKVVGLEASYFMLEIALKAIAHLAPYERENIRLVQGDMCNFHFRRPFPLIIIPYSSFWYNFERNVSEQGERPAVRHAQDDAHQCLRCIVANLVSKGKFIIDGCVPPPALVGFWENASRDLGFRFMIIQPYRDSTYSGNYGQVLVGEKIS